MIIEGDIETTRIEDIGSVEPFHLLLIYLLRVEGAYFAYYSRVSNIYNIAFI
jgi:hypothetical protein